MDRPSSYCSARLMRSCEHSQHWSGEVNLKLERGTFQFRPFRSNPAFTSYFQLCSLGLEAKRALSTFHSSMNAFPEINLLPSEVPALISPVPAPHKDLVYTAHMWRRWCDTLTAFPSLRSSRTSTAHTGRLVAHTWTVAVIPLDATFFPYTLPWESSSPFVTYS